VAHRRLGGRGDREAHLDEAHILAALERFAAERDERRLRLRELLDGDG